jgi:CheB methylesterase
MLRSAAVCCGARTVGVVLTGTLGDGASGLWAVRQCGGLTVVQDPNDAQFAEMPLTALDKAEPDHLVRLADMPALLTSLTHQPAGRPQPVLPSLPYEVNIARGARGSVVDLDNIAPIGPGLPRLWRRHVGDRGRRAGAVPLPCRPHLYCGADERCNARWGVPCVLSMSVLLWRASCASRQSTAGIGCFPRGGRTPAGRRGGAGGDPQLLCSGWIGLPEKEP